MSIVVATGQVDHPARALQLRRRIRQRVDDLGHLADTASATIRIATPHHRSIAQSLFKFDVWTYETLMDAWYIQEIASKMDDEFANLIYPGIPGVVDWRGNGDPTYRKKIQEAFEKLGDAEVLDIIHNTHVADYYREMMSLDVTIYRSVTFERQHAFEKPESPIPKLYEWCETHPVYRLRLQTELGERRQRLKDIVREARTLRGNIKVASANGALIGQSLDSLKN